jgi:hypothetical protein
LISLLTVRDSHLTPGFNFIFIHHLESTCQRQSWMMKLSLTKINQEIYAVKKALLSKRAGGCMVGQDRIELSTLGFSVRCSTD